MRWSCLCLAAFLALAPVCAYAQCHYDDYDPVRLPVSAHNMDDSLPVWPSSPTAEQLVSYTQELAGCPYLKADITNADWEVVSQAGGYSVFASAEGSGRYAFVYLPDGRLAAYQAVDTLPPVSQRLMAQEGFEDELARYALAFLDTVAPSVSNAVEAFTGAEALNREGVITGSLRALTFVTGRQRDGAFLEIELEPVVRIVSYRLAPAMLQHLWGQNLFSVREPSLSILNDPLYQEKKSSILSPEALLPSVKTLLKSHYGETDASLSRFDLQCELMAEGEPYVWLFHLCCCTFGDGLLDDYQVRVDAHTGEVLETAAYEDGKG